MLPFLKKKVAPPSGLIVETRNEKPEIEEEHDSSAIEACAMELIIGVHLKDTKAVAEALKNAFDILEAMPHEEGETSSPHTYEAQNKIAGERK